MKPCEHILALIAYMQREGVFCWGEDDMGSVPDHYSCDRCKIEDFDSQDMSEE